MSYHAGKDPRGKKIDVTLDDDVAVTLALEAEKQGITPDELLDDIVRKHILYNFLASHKDHVEFPNPDLDIILKLLKPDHIRDVARRQVEDTFDEISNQWHVRLDDPNSIIEQFYKRYGRHTGWFDFKYGVTKDGLRLTLSHNHDSRWSIFLAEYNDTILRRIFDTIQVQIHPDAVVFDVSLSQDNMKSYMHSMTLDRSDRLSQSSDKQNS